MKFRIEIGDRSGDGHGKYDVFVVKANTNNVERIMDAHCKLKNMGLDFEEICSNYEEYSIKEEKIKLIKGLGVCIEDFLDIDEYEGRVTYYAGASDDFLGIFLECLNAIDKTLESKIYYEKMEYIDIRMGYGVYSN